MGRKRDFVMEPNGLCFFCLKRAGPLTPMHRHVKREPEVDTNTSTFPIYSLQCFSRFLKMEVRKVFSDQELIPKHLLTKVENSALKVELCEECAHLLDKFSQLHQYLQKIKMEVMSSLNNIYEKFLDANGKSLSEELEKLTGEHSDDIWKNKLNIMDILRTEAIQKSHAMICSITPRVKVENLTRSKVTRKKLKLKQNSAISVITPQSSIAQAETSSFKIPVGKLKEECPMRNFDCYDGDEMSNFSDDFEMHSDDLHTTSFEEVATSSKQTERESNVAETRDSDPLRELKLPNRKRKMGRKSVITTDTYTVTSFRPPTVVKPPFNQRTRKYICPACQKEFPYVAHFKIHFAAVHEKIKYKCTLCTKSFSQKANYITHYKVAHKGVRVKCHGCGSLFTQHVSLRRHQRGTSCGQKRASNKLK